ncbi:hypothetical protein LshimejAT787_0300520 [Lyophyllum shimeji]|uniref:Uncharacterized protein n=1 Tax=Lyophyllum shimeji TaxID=47721 RepID=A0A9P3PHW2_LYOSH|nr:hypothetical protein LshimejAT787_0300520 [Lyophyllum shimeji]
MENRYPDLPSLSMLFLDYEESRSAGMVPADNPTFYKPGESSRLPQKNPAIHPPPTLHAFRSWPSAGLPYDDEQRYPFSSSTTYHQMSNEEFREWIRTDAMDVADMRDYDQEPYFAPSPQYAETQKPTWESASCSTSSMPASAARSSLDSASRQDASGMYWLGSHHEQEHHRFGLETPPPLDAGAYFDDHACLFNPGPQPQNHRHDPTQSPYSLVFPASSLAPSSIPTVSPVASSESPASLSTSPSSSPDIVIHTPTIPLHQPRPARPIPIIPLSKLASACEEFYMPPSTRRTTFSKSEVPAMTAEPMDLMLSPLSPQLHAYYASSFSPKPAPLQDNSFENMVYVNFEHGFEENSGAPNDPRYSYSGGGPEISCACGCMESYRIPCESTM